MNVNLVKFHFEHNVPHTLNLTLTLIDSVNKSKCEMKTQFSASVSRDMSASRRTYNTVPGELTSKFTMSEKPYIWSWLCDANVKMY